MSVEDSGALSSQGRFERMEQALMRIEQKLDKKADSEDLKELERRVTRHGQEIDTLERLGTANAQEALVIAKANTLRIIDLEAHDKTEVAIKESNQQRNATIVKFVGALATVATAINMIVGAWVLLGAH